MWYDIVCLVILALSAWRGMVKGFIWQLASIAGIILCFIFAETVSLAVAPLTGLEPPLSRWISILGLYIVSSFGAFAIARMIQGGLEKAKFEDYDRHLGAVFGAVKGATICLVLSFFMFTLSESSRSILINSQSGYASALVFSKISPVMPAELHKILDPYLVGFDPETIVQKREAPEQKTDESKFPLQSWAMPHSDPDIVGLLQQIPGLVGPELQQIVYQTIEQTEPQDRPELVEQLSTGLPGLIRQVAEQWKNGKPTSASSTSSSLDWKQHRAQLLKQIAGIYTEHLEAQQTIMEEIVYSLHGLPDQITLLVLEDWHADLLGKSPDPDPATDISAPLDRRIANQVSRANISVSSLPREIQERLLFVTQNR